MADVFKQYVEGLEELNTHVASRLLTQDVQEEGEHVLLQEEAEHVQERGHNLIISYNKYQRSSVGASPADEQTLCSLCVCHSHLFHHQKLLIKTNGFMSLSHRKRLNL